jgi:hypothetical protein
MNATTVAVDLAKNVFEHYSLSWLAPAAGEPKMNALDAMTITEHGKKRWVERANSTNRQAVATRELAREGREAAGYRISEGGVSSPEIAPEQSISSVIWRRPERFCCRAPTGRLRSEHGHRRHQALPGQPAR